MNDHSDISNTGLQELQLRIGYTFKNVSLLVESLTHKSYANEKQSRNLFGNERLEFIGDAVLGLVISHILMDRVKDCAEGKLSSMRAAIVNEDELSKLARSFNIGSCIYLSRGEEESNGRDKKSILANAYEALIAGVYYDGGYDAAFKLIQHHCGNLIDAVVKKGFYRDYKSRLQEYAHRHMNAIPRYTLITEEGPDHEKFFESQVFINTMAYEKGYGSTKKASEQDAAEKTLKHLLDEAHEE